MTCGRFREATVNRAFAVWLRALEIAFIAFAAPAMFPTPCPAAEATAEEVEVNPGLIREIQFMLLRLGMDPGPIDGVAGPKTTKAFLTFVERSGMPVQPLVNGGRISGALLARLRTEASRVILGGEAKPETSTAPAAATPPPTPAPSAQPTDRFADCSYRPEDFRIGNTQYTPDKYLQEGFDGSTARAVAMLKDRLNEARQIAGSLGGAALAEVQRQARVLDYFTCRLKVEEASATKK
jgi:peptidoglycan hydrolase-like protein with peptidoglycan-binding domain